MKKIDVAELQRAAEEHGVAPRDIDLLRDVRNTLYSRWLGQAPRLVAGVTGVPEALQGKLRHPYLLAVEKSGVGREDCVAIEDSERGLESAIRAGIRCIVVPTALTRGGTFVGAHRVLGSVSELPTALSGAT